MPIWLSDFFEKTNSFIPHGHCYLWIPSLLWLHVISDALIGTAYVAISFLLYFLVRRIRLPFSPVFIAFGLFIGLCGLTHFINIWTVWNPDYWAAGLLKAATAAASVATAIGLIYVRPQIEEVVHAARLSEERRIRLESTNAELEKLYDKLKEQDELKTQFFANISHELRTPLALILGPAERMLTDDNLTEAQRRQLTSIGRNSKSLLRQVNDLLDVARLEEGRLQANYVRLDVALWFRRVSSQFEVAAEQRQIRFDVQTPERLMAEVDADMLERVLINLLANAFKFTPEGGEIRAILESTGESRFRFSVSDSGPGIRPEQRNIIFERFRQTDGSATRRHGGVGLGLAIARDFVQLHAGTIEVDDAPAGGARFSVTLPIKAPASAEVATAAETLASTVTVALESAVGDLTQRNELGEMVESANHSPDRPTVLVVEDTEELSQFLAATLRKHYNVVTAVDGYEGLERAIALRPDLIVTDVMMPRMSGDQLVAALREREEFNSMPILLLTAREDDEFRVRVLRGGAQDYLTKPFVPDELLARVDNLVAVKRTGDLLRKELQSASADVENLAGQLAARHRDLKVALELAEVARERAEQAGEVKSHFLAMVSHEMRTPLSTISMNADLLGRHPEVQSSAAFRTQLDRTIRATQQLATVIEGLLEYTRVESGKTAVRIEAIDAVEIAREVVEFGRLQNQSPEVTLSLELPETPLPHLQTDPRLLRVMLNNLVANALKFTVEGRVSLQLSADSDWHRFAVRDTGIGIAKADLRRIFLPFEQVEPVQRKSVPGVGLGLALTKELVEALGGALQVESEEGVGSTFCILLPSDAKPLLEPRDNVEEKV